MPSNASRVRVFSLFLGCAVVAISLACSTKNMHDTGLPGWKTKVEVAKVLQLDRYLEVHFKGDGFEVERFFQANDRCRELFVPGRRLEYATAASFGEFRDGDLNCTATGVADLEKWRRRFGKNSSLTTAAPIPRAQANYKLVTRKADRILLRGRFPLASNLRVSGTSDLVLVLPRSPECDQVASRETASMEYRPSGNPALALLASQGRCNVWGFVAPLNVP
ncbi:MAG: hypothetical protein JRC77_10305 [Deltaproteobacteria bacterium]|nr:hypothetical protein [Deltaproteobacteria bacterium]